MSWVKAYGAVSLKNLLVYKFEIVIWAILHPASVIIYWFLWNAIYSNSSQEIIKGFTFNELMIYYIITLTISIVIWTDLDAHLSRRIIRGSLTRNILRPVKYLHGIIVSWFANKSIVVPIQATILIAIGIYFFNLAFTNYIHLLLFLTSVILALLLSIMFVFTVGLSSFWLKSYTGVRALREGITWFFGGLFIPLTFFPEWLQQLSYYLPFQYMMYIPTQIFLNKFEQIQIIQLLGIQIFWIIVFIVLSSIIWRLGLKKFSAAGG